MARLISRTILLFTCFLLTLPSLFAQIDLHPLRALEARSIGPAGMSGRVTSIDVVTDQPEVIYVGTASGGLWKSDNGGASWMPLFDDQPVASIGAVALHQKNPNIIWVGTGEGNPRNSQTSGGGVFRSLDGGETWELMGLEATRNIHRIIVHPDDPNTVWVGAQGVAWGTSPHRGIYKTTDGGESWEHVLSIDDSTGIADMVIDPSNPNKLIAAMWTFQRDPYFFNSGGEGSGIFVSYDGGENWTRRTALDGLPGGNLGRIGLAIAPSQPQRVYALVEAKENAIYRSDDGGRSWRKVSERGNFGNRPFYYADLYVDPNNENRIYSIHSIVTFSEDGGKSWETLIGYYNGGVHPDHHAWYIHPENPDFIINGNDGGLAISRDRGESWHFVENLPLAQFYHINYDNLWPYNVYGGMQDNGSWRGPAYAWRNGGIRNAYWDEISFGDGFDVVPDPRNARYGYSMWQGGNLVRYDVETGHTQYMKPLGPDSAKLRFNWNAAIAQDPFDPATIYYGSQFVHKSTNRGNSWTTISPDLTTNDTTKQQQAQSGGLTLDVTNAENYTSLVAIAPSPAERGVIWAGSDDGRLHLSRDGGESWTSMEDRLPGLPDNAWIPFILPNNRRGGEAYVVANNYRQNDWKPYLYRTRNYGQSWERVVDADDVDGHVLAIAQDPIEPKLLFLGTEYGLYVSFDEGNNWQKWTHGFPTVSTMDLKIHPRENDLIVGTFGRAAYILDDIRPLRKIAQEGGELFERELVAFDPPQGVIAERRQPAGTRFSGDAMYSGENRRSGAMLTYYVREGQADPKAEAMRKRAGKTELAPKEEPARGRAKKRDRRMTPEPVDTAKTETKPRSDTTIIEIFDASGELIRTLRHQPDSGINRIYWDMRAKGVRGPNSPKPKKAQSDPPGLHVMPGTYKIRYTYGDDRDSTQVRVLMDPRMEVADGALENMAALRMEMVQLLERVTAASDALRDGEQSLGRLSQIIDSEDSTLNEQLGTVRDTLKTLKIALMGEEDTKGITDNSYTLTSKIWPLNAYITSNFNAQNPTATALLRRVEPQVDAYIERVNRFFQEDFQEFREAVEASELKLFEEFEEIR